MPDPIRVAAVGDVHLADDLRGRYAPLLTDISEEADALLVAGDLTQHGTVEEAEAFADEFDAADVPVLVVLGNHDYHSGAERDIARLNLERSAVRAPVNGFVTNLELRPGDYLSAGRAALALVDSDSFHIAGYFEETKLPRIRPGDRATARVMGEAGLIEVLSVLPESYPGQALLTDDVGILVAEDGCACGRRGRHFRIRSRVAQAEVRGCGDTFAAKRVVG